MGYTPIEEHSSIKKENRERNRYMCSRKFFEYRVFKQSFSTCVLRLNRIRHSRLPFFMSIKNLYRLAIRKNEAAVTWWCGSKPCPSPADSTIRRAAEFWRCRIPLRVQAP